ncbi:hypothetical protein [Rhodanobacter aciditrophus]|uniref:hypothetical protein n=1 Tax=Rhodanobacter aciditrophus TaxID=1623218 RepID=UPI003CF2A6C7
MHPRAWFGAAVRVIGVWMVVQSASSFVYAFNLVKGLDSLRSISPMAMVNQGVGYFVVGLFLVKLAPLVVSWAYPRRSEASTQDAEEPAKEDEG